MIEARCIPPRRFNGGFSHALAVAADGLIGIVVPQSPGNIGSHEPRLALLVGNDANVVPFKGLANQIGHGLGPVGGWAAG